MGSRHRWRKGHEPPGCYELLGVFPDSGREPGKASRPERRRFHHIWPLDWNAEDVGLKLHEPVVVGCATIDAKPLELKGGSRGIPHALQDVRGSVRHRFERGS